MYKQAENKNALTINDLREHSIVRVSQLDKIYDTYMLLINSKLLPDGDVEGELVYFGNGDSTEYKKWFLSDVAITPLFFDSGEYVDGVVYDE